MQQLITTPNKVKCINLDWLSVYCLEPKGCAMNAAYFKALGWTVEEREYGTPQYREKFTLMNGRHPFLEIERNPYSLKQNGGIFEPESCHIRLANRTLYQPQPVQQLTNFIVKYGYEYKGISRVDVCCDLTIFDNGMKPQDLANKYMKDKIWKVHQSHMAPNTDDGDDTWRIKVHLGAHGKETKTGRTWNSLKWGSPKSALSTKLYNKTYELETNTGKFYIKDTWVKAGLCDLQKVTYEYKNPKTKEIEIRTKQVCVVPGTAVDREIPIEGAKKIDVWRVEFSMNSGSSQAIQIIKGIEGQIDNMVIAKVYPFSTLRVHRKFNSPYINHLCALDWYLLINCGTRNNAYLFCPYLSFFRFWVSVLVSYLLEVA